METKIFNLIILDESGSMCCVRNEAINNVNESLQTIRKAQKENFSQKHYVSFVTFNDTHKTIWNCIPALEAKEITAEDYHPNCTTALYDAMGFSINALSAQVSDNDRVLVTVVTDGMENASREYDRHSIKKMIDELKAKGWVFAYIGANHDVEKTAANISIHNTLVFKADAKGVDEMTLRTNIGRERLYREMSDKNFDSNDANCRFFDL